MYDIIRKDLERSTREEGYYKQVKENIEDWKKEEPNNPNIPTLITEAVGDIEDTMSDCGWADAFMKAADVFHNVDELNKETLVHQLTELFTKHFNK